MSNNDKDKQAVNLHINREFYKKVKAKAALDGKTVNEWICDVLQKELANKEVRV